VHTGVGCREIVGSNLQPSRKHASEIDRWSAPGRVRVVPRAGRSTWLGSVFPGNARALEIPADEQRHAAGTGRRGSRVTSPVLMEGRPEAGPSPITAGGARDVVEQGYKVLRTNLIAEGGTDGKARRLPPANLDGASTTQDRRRGDLDRHPAGRGGPPDIGIALDGSSVELPDGAASSSYQKALEPFELYWLEVESLDPDALWPHASRQRPDCATERASYGARVFGVLTTEAT